MNIFSFLISLFFLACGKQGTSLPDPPINPPSDEVEQYGTPFANVTDRQDAVIYQVNIRVFSPAGNFAGVTARLDSIKALGVNVIYLMPTYPVGVLKAINSPYCIKDYSKVNPEFGTLNDLRALVDGAHSRNMSVIMDWVANHTSWDHVWMSSHKDWYMQDGNGNVVNPPNTGWNDVAQLNYNSLAMRKEMIKLMKYWILTANVDGFRCDYVDGVPLDFWRSAIDTLRNMKSRKLLMLAEGSRNGNFSVGFDYNFGFGFFNNLKDVFEKNKTVTSIDQFNESDYSGSGQGQQIVRYITNHDVNSSDGTPQELFGGQKGSMAAFAVVALMKSVPMIYTGQEVGTPARMSFPFTSTKINWTLYPEVTAEYKRLIAFRNSSRAVRRGTLSSFSNADICAFTKESDNEKVFVLSNLRDKKIPFNIPAALRGSVWTDVMSGESVTLTDTVELDAFQYLVFKN